MRDYFKRIKLNALISAIATLVLGIALLFWPATALTLLCRVIAIGLIIIGLSNMFTYVGARKTASSPYSGIIGIIALLIGIWMYTNPESVVSIIPIIIGVIMLFHGLRDIQYAFETRRNEGSFFGSILAGIISCILGLLCISHAFGVVAFTLQIIGIFLIYDGISDLIVIYRTSKSLKDLQQNRDAVDGNFKEL
ncbi:MAG: DUF308 domain-containing protein [Lachnospiraceae bacterium]|nr:DUF308 domain-containing protein [Lachnospiraceae bacterium]